MTKYLLAIVVEVFQVGWIRFNVLGDFVGNLVYASWQGHGRSVTNRTARKLSAEAGEQSLNVCDGLSKA